MEFVNNLSKEEYINYFNTCRSAHFLQSYESGQTQKAGRNLIPYYVGLKDNKKVVAAALLLKRKTPLNMCYFYCPRGFILDYNNKQVFKEFIKGLKEFLKSENAIYLKVDPGIKYQDIDSDANRIENGLNNHDLFNRFLELGFKHKGFYKLYEGNQPRYTIRVDLKQNMDEIKKNISKTFMKTVRKSFNYDLEIVQSDDIKTFHELIKNNATKDGFKPYSLNYYQGFYDSFKQQKHAKIFNAIIYPEKVLKKITTELNELKDKIQKGLIPEKRLADTNNQIKRLEKDIDILSEYKDYKNGKVICSLICSYTNYAAWTLYIGNDSLGMYTSAVNRCYYEALLDAKNNNLDFYDLFGTVGDPKTTYKNLAGLHEFKRKFGGEYIEFMGEFDLINKPLWYKLLPTLLKIYRKILKKGY